MAWYDITYKCGHTGREQICGTNVHGEREKRAAWIAENKLCPECYKAAMRKKNEEMGLVCSINVDTMKMITKGEKGYIAVFNGDTYPHKDEIKALGAKWEEAAQGVMGDIFGGPSKKTWCLHFSPDEVDEIIDKIEGLGARIESLPSDFDMAALSKLNEKTQE